MPATQEPKDFRLARAEISNAASEDWFSQANAFDDSALFLCRVHGVLEDRKTAQQDWAQALLNGGVQQASNDPLLNALSQSKSN